MQKFDKQWKILLVIVITVVILYFFYKGNEKKDVVYGYDYLIGLSLPNTSVSMNENLIQNVNINKDNDKDVNILVKEAQDNVEQQLKDIIELKNHGIDLLIISPIRDERIYEKLGEMEVPIVVLNDRKAIDYAEAYLEYDNWNAGELLAEYIESIDSTKNQIVLLSGKEGESISEEREEGFIYNLSTTKRDKIEKMYCNWRRNDAENQIKAYLVSGKKLTKVISLSDEMAYGAYLAAKKLRVENVMFYGINAFRGKDNGMDLFEKGILHNTVKFEDMYQNMMDVALAILKGESYEKETILKAGLVR